MKIVVSCDSTCDLGDELISKNDIRIMPLVIYLGEEQYSDNVDVTTKDIFAYVDKTGVLPKTAARSIYEYQEFFANILKDADAIIHVAFSSEMSSSCSNAQVAAEQLNNVKVVDSKSLSTGYGLLVLKACKLVSLGKSLDEIEKELVDTVPKLQASFIISNLKYLYKGGRCSAVAMFGANLLKIKPSIHVVDGKMGVGKKYMGKFSDTMIKYTNALLEENGEIDKENVFITFSSDENNVSNLVYDLLKEHGFQNIYKTFAGCTIASHCGPECMGVLFIRK